MPSRQLNRLLWVTFAVLIVFFGLKARDRLTSYLDAVGTLEVAEDGGIVRMKWTGEIEAPMAEKLAQVFARHGTDNAKFILALNSPGGSLDQGAEVMRLLRKIEATHQLDTVVEADDVCASMCVPVYLQGQRRTAAASAHFLFHEVSYFEVLADKKSEVPASATQSATDAFFAKYFTPAGLNPEWLQSVRKQIAGGHNIWKTARQLVDEKSGVVLDMRE